jgi:hypothetical protein
MVTSLGGAPDRKPSSSRQSLLRNVLGGAVPSIAMDEFLTGLPEPGIQQISFIEQKVYSPEFPRYHELKLAGVEVPEQMVYVWTDVLFFGLTPSVGLNAAPAFLPQASLNGFIRFQIQFSNASAMELEGTFVTTANPSTVPSRAGGWPFSNRPFGVQRSSGWALYAREGVTVDVTAAVDLPPSFPINALGVEMHGFSLTHDMFQRKIVKDWRGLLID